MTVKELIFALQECNPDAEVHASDIYGEGVFPITGYVYDEQEVTLTGENLK
ncbi:MAG: hypothetical protein IIB99_04985 [Planctomycetes bacterium]|nr:hypothetical protein [Planctomycetota bacterium]